MTLELKVMPPVQFMISAGLMYSLSSYSPQYYFDLSIKLPLIIILILAASVISILALYNFHKQQTTFHPHTPEKTTTVVNTGILPILETPCIFLWFLPCSP